MKIVEGIPLFQVERAERQANTDLVPKDILDQLAEKQRTLRLSVYNDYSHIVSMWQKELSSRVVCYVEQYSLNYVVIEKD